MAKQPYIPLYIGDWEQDTNCLTPLAEFALLKLIFKLFRGEKKGVFVANYRTLSVLFKSNIDDTKDIFQELIDNNILDIIKVDEGKFEIKSRRMLREGIISETRSEVGKSGGRGNKKQNKSKSKAKVKQNPDIDIDIKDEINIDVFNENKYLRDEILEKSILYYFNFNELNNPDKQSLIFQFCTALHGSKKLEDFRKQFEFYCEYKNIAGFKHNFNKFLGNQNECFSDGAWNSENWELKLTEEKEKSSGKKENKPSATAEAINRATTRLSKYQNQ